MKLIQKIGMALGLVAAMTVSAVAQLEVGTLTSGLPATFSVAAASTNTTIANTNLIINVTRGVNVAIQPIIKLQGAGTSAVTFVFEESVDGSTWATAAISAAVTPAGTTQVTDPTNHSLGAIGFLRLAEIRNPNATALTNITVKYSIKTGL